MKETKADEVHRVLKGSESNGNTLKGSERYENCEEKVIKAEKSNTNPL